MMLKSLPLRVLAISFIVLALPLLIDSFIFFQHAYEHSLSDAKRTLKEVATFRAFAISELDPVRQVLLKELTVLADLKTVIPHLPNKEFNQSLARINEIDPSYQVTILAPEKDNHFKILASSHPDIVGRNFISDILVRRVLEQGTEGDFIRFHYFPSQQKNIPYVYVVRAIQATPHAEPIGILIFTSPLDVSLAPLVQPVKERGSTLQFAVLTPDEVVFFATDPALVGQFFTPLSLERKLELTRVGQLGTLKLAEQPLLLIQRQSTPFFEFIFNNTVQIAYATPIPEIQLSFVAYTAKEQLFSKSIRHFLLVYSVYGLIFIIGGGVTYWLSTWISRPLVQICSMMEKVEKGNLAVRFKEEPFGFELNILGTSLNQMLDSLFENIQKAENERVLKETYQKELELGQEAQRNLLPQKIQHIPGIEVEGSYTFSKEVGGDFYDVFLKDDKRIILTIADAAGKGISACIYALAVRSLFRTYSTLHDDLGTILSKTNNMFLQDTGNTGMFVTALMCLYDVEKKTLSYYSCGHVPCLVRRADGQLVTLSHSGMALGLIESVPFQIDKIELFSGDFLILYTDGLIDATNDKYQHFSEKRLRHLLQQNKWTTPKEMVQGLLDEVMAFTGGELQGEEITILCMMVLCGGKTRRERSVRDDFLLFGRPSLL